MKNTSTLKYTAMPFLPFRGPQVFDVNATTLATGEMELVCRCDRMGSATLIAKLLNDHHAATQSHAEEPTRI